MLIPHGDTVYAITPINILLMGVANVDPSWRYSLCYYPNQHIAHRGWQMLIPHGDAVYAITPINILLIGGGKC